MSKKEMSQAQLGLWRPLDNKTKQPLSDLVETMSDDSVRQRIISSVFSRRNGAGMLEETYVAHIKTWEDAGPEGGGRKPRYILISETINETGFIHKSKLNSNGSFSVGKTWRIAELRGVQVIDPLTFGITLSRTYTWQTENPVEQTSFLLALVRLFRKVTAGGQPLRLEGLQEPDTSQEHDQRAPSSRSQSRAGPSSRPASPTASGNRPRDPTPSRSRPHSPAWSQSSTVRSARPRRPSGAASTSSQIPSTQPPPPASRPTPVERVQKESSARSTPRPSLDLPPGPPYTQSGLSPSTTRPRPVSPAISSSSRKQLSQDGSPDPPHSRRDLNARISFFDPVNQAALERLLSGSSGAQNEAEGEEESVQATMADVEEMLEGYEWASEDVLGRRSSRGAADLIEARLLDELMALEKANIYSFLESDDRIGVVLKYLDEAISELDSMGSLVSSYKIHLNAVSDDISYIQSQNRGLQVQTQNQRVLLGELENLLQTVQVDIRALNVLTQESLDKSTSIQKLEEAASQLYKALQAGRDTDMAATMERLSEYRLYNSQFCKRMSEFLSLMFIARSKMLLGDTDGITKPGGRGRPTLINHKDIETYLQRYAGLMLYLKEMDEGLYAKLCAAYFSAIRDLHSQQIRALFTAYANSVMKALDDDQEPHFGVTPTSGTFKGTGSMRRAGTLLRSPTDFRKDKDKDKDKNADRDLRAAEVFALILEQVAPQIYREEEFITDFLQINDSALTFADYMGLDNYFRRQAARGVGLSQTTVKLVHGAMDIIFGFLPAALKTWIDDALAMDNMQIIGVTACLERFLADADERGSVFLQGLLDKQHMRLKGLFDRHVNEQIQAVEKNKLSSKKRQGVASFIKHFPNYVSRVENQLIGADGLEIRGSVDLAYERIVKTMFDSLQQMAKMNGEGDEKGQLNYHVILIENMHHFVAEIAGLEIGTMKSFFKQAEGIYEENLNAYVKIVLRRPFSKLLDYFEGIERLLKTTAPTEVPSSSSSYNASALKKVVKEYNAKDVRKHIDTLYKRVEKHFTEASEKATTESGGITPGTVMVGVWKACETELLRITEVFSNRISQCYGQSGISLEYTQGDVEAAFRGHRVGS